LGLLPARRIEQIGRDRVERLPNGLVLCATQWRFGEQPQILVQLLRRFHADEHAIDPRCGSRKGKTQIHPALAAETLGKASYGGDQLSGIKFLDGRPYRWIVGCKETLQKNAAHMEGNAIL